MRKKILLFGLPVFVALTALATVWKYDKSHQKVAFSVSHMTLSESEGYFKDVDATITASKSDFSDAVAEMTIKATSVNTDDEKRDEHLRSADFFDTDKYPNITFKSTSFKKAKGPNQYVIAGNLTMHGVTKPVTLAGLAKLGTNPYSKSETAGFKMLGKLKRKDFGVGSSTPDAIVGNTISFTINAEFIKQ